MIRTVLLVLLSACGGTRTWIGEGIASSDASVDAGAKDPTCFDPVSSEGDPVAQPIGQLALGSEHTCAQAGDTVYCWGVNVAGQLGDGSQRNRSRPAHTKLTNVTAITSSTSLDTGCKGTRMSHTCARLADGRVSCWGSNVEGKSTDTLDTPWPVPLIVSNLTNVVQVAVGGFHNCARLTGDTASCWGRSSTGALGDGTMDPGAKGPTPVKGLTEVKQVTVGDAHSCALHANGTVSCWGRGDDGELGDGTTASRALPAPVASLTNAVMISSSWRDTCALLGDRTVVCWGASTDAKGVLSTVQHQTKPVKVEGLQDVLQIAVGKAHACAVLVDRTVQCWGAFASKSPQPPARIMGLVNAFEVKVGDGHSCVRDHRAGIWCWGSNSAGQLGDGTTLSRVIPVKVLP